MKKLLRIKAVMERTGSSRPQIYKLMPAGLFLASRPDIRKHGGLGLETEIDASISEKIAARDAANKKPKRDACPGKHAAGAAA